MKRRPDECGICGKSINLFQRGFPLYGDTLKGTKLLREKIKERGFQSDGNFHRKCVIKETKIGKEFV